MNNMTYGVTPNCNMNISKTSILGMRLVRLPNSNMETKFRDAATGPISISMSSLTQGEKRGS
jgi:hypothetical protein